MVCHLLGWSIGGLVHTCACFFVCWFFLLMFLTAFFRAARCTVVLDTQRAKLWNSRTFIK